MIKFETLGMRSVAKNKPTVTSNTDVANYSLITVDGELAIVMNEPTGHDSYVDDYVIPAGKPLNTYKIAPHMGQELVVDVKHISGTASLIVKNAVLVVDGTGLKVGGSYAKGDTIFTVTEITKLTGKAVKVRVGTATAASTSD